MKKKEKKREQNELISKNTPASLLVKNPLKTPVWLFTALHAHELGGVVDNQLLGRERHLLELGGVGSGDLGTSDSDRGSLEVVPGVLGSESQQLSTNTEAGEAGLDGHHVTSLLDGLDNGLDIKRLDGTEVDDLGLDAVLLLELLGGDQRLTDAAREGDDGKVLSGTLDLGLAELWNRVSKVWGGF